MIYDERLAKIISSASCLEVLAELNSSEEASQLIDFIGVLKIEKKSLLIQMATHLRRYLMQKKVINYNVAINHLGQGA